MRRRLLALLILGCAVIAPRGSFAACAGPAGIAGDVMYNGTYNVLQYCNGTLWINAGSTANFGALTAGDFCTTDGTNINCTNTGLLPAANGGTGVANSNTITLGGNVSTAGALTTSGAFALTLTTTGATNVTLPTSGTLVNSGVATLSSLASIGTITTGVWNGTPVATTYGGLGGNFGSSTGALSIASGTVTAGTLSVGNGGTGAATFTANGVLYGNTASAIQVTAQGAANSVLTANAGAPSFSASPTIGTSVTAPLVIGGTGAGSTLTLESTSGTGTSDAILFKTGSQAEAMRINTSGNVGIGTTIVNPTGGTSYGKTLDVVNTTSGSRAILELWSNVAPTSGWPHGQINFLSGTSSLAPAAVILSAPSGTTANTGDLEFWTSNTTGGITSPQMVITTTGNVGIGMTGPASVFQVRVGTDQNVAINSTGGVGRLSSYNDAASVSEPLIVNGSDLRLANNNVEAVRITGGNVGIGTTSPVTFLDIKGNNVTFAGQLRIAATDYDQITFYNSSATNPNGTNRLADIYYDISGSTLYIENETNTKNLVLNQSGGNVGIGVTPSHQLQLGGDDAYKPNGGSWGNSSDERLKTNITPVTEALAKISQLNPVLFEWKNPALHGNNAASGGFIAQQMERVFPDFVTQSDCVAEDCKLTGGGKEYGMSLPFTFDAYLVGAVKELKADNDNLRREFEAYKAAHP